MLQLFIISSHKTGSVNLLLEKKKKSETKSQKVSLCRHLISFKYQKIKVHLKKPNTITKISQPN